MDIDVGTAGNAIDHRKARPGPCPHADRCGDNARRRERGGGRQQHCCNENSSQVHGESPPSFKAQRANGTSVPGEIVASAEKLNLPGKMNGSFISNCCCAARAVPQNQRLTSNEHGACHTRTHERRSRRNPDVTTCPPDRAPAHRAWSRARSARAVEGAHSRWCFYRPLAAVIAVGGPVRCRRWSSFLNRHGPMTTTSGGTEPRSPQASGRRQ